MESEMKTKTKKGVTLLVEALKNEGVEVLFGYPGGAVLHIYDEFYKSESNHVLTRHEQGAVHAADGYARATGKPGVCIVTSGPGATNALTGIATAQMDSIPLIVITGQVHEAGIGKDAFQETDMIGMTTPVTKYNYQVRDAKDIPRIIHEAFYLANTGRKGPVVIDIPKNIGVQEVECEDCTENIGPVRNLPGYNPECLPVPEQVAKVNEAIAASKKPIMLAGQGVIHAQAEKELLAFAEYYQIPVVNTLLGLGSFPVKHELALGMGGMHGSYASNMALMECDLLLNFGARFDDRVASDPTNFAPEAVIVHVDIDNAEIGKIMHTDIPVLSDAKLALLMLNDTKLAEVPDHSVWFNHVMDNKKQHPFRYEKSDTFIKPQHVVEYIGELTNGEAIVVTDVGQHQMWAAQYYPFTRGKQLLTSGGLGTMGFGIPAAIGAKMAYPDKTVVCFVGDGGFQMTNQELAILNANRLDVKYFILNNEVLGMVHQWQHLSYDGRFSHSEIPDSPDFVKLADAYGITAARVSDPDEVDEAIQTALDYPGPYVLDILISKDELVLPMVASGRPNNEMKGV